MRRHRPIMNAMKHNPSAAWASGSPYWRSQAAWATSPSSRCPPGTVMGADYNCYPTLTAQGAHPASACPSSAPYVCTGFPNQCSAYPPDHPLHGVDCKSYVTPGGSSGGLGTMVGKLGRALNPMNSPIMRIAMPKGSAGGMTMYGDRRTNPQPTLFQRIAARFTG